MRGLLWSFVESNRDPKKSPKPVPRPDPVPRPGTVTKAERRAPTLREGLAQLGLPMPPPGVGETENDT